MTIITKAALAAELKVSKARVSQYVTAGLPVRGDGKLDRETALNWIGLNLRSGASHEKGPAKARAIQPQPGRTLGDAEAARRALVGFAGHVGFYIAGTAADLGIPMRLAYALLAEVADGLDDVAAEQLLKLGTIGARRLVSGSKALQPDWADLADRVGEPVDLPAWEAFRAEMHARLYGAEPEGADLAQDDDT